MRSFLVGFMVGVGVALWAHRWRLPAPAVSPGNYTFTYTPTSRSSAWWQDYGDPHYWTKVH